MCHHANLLCFHRLSSALSWSRPFHTSGILQYSWHYLVWRSSWKTGLKYGLWNLPSIHRFRKYWNYMMLLNVIVTLILWDISYQLSVFEFLPFSVHISSCTLGVWTSDEPVDLKNKTFCKSFNWLRVIPVVLLSVIFSNVFFWDSSHIRHSAVFLYSFPLLK